MSEILILLSVVGAAVLLVLYTVAYFRAERPRPGTLEWIHIYDPIPFRLRGKRANIETDDLLPLLAVLLFSGLFWRLLAYLFFPALRGAVLVKALWVLLPMLLSSFFFYLLVKQLTGARMLSMLAAFLLTLESNCDIMTLCFTTATLLFVLRFMTNPIERAVVWDGFDLGLSIFFTVVGAYISPVLLLMLPPVLFLLVFTIIHRARHDDKPNRLSTALKYLTSALLFTTVPPILIHIPGAIVSGMPFPQLLVSTAFYRGLWQTLCRIFVSAFDICMLTPVLLADGLLLLISVFSVIALLYLLVCKKEPAALFLLVFGVSTLFVFLLSNSFVFAVPAIAAVSYLASRLQKRQKPCLSYLLPAFLLLNAIAIHFLIYT